MAAVLALKGIAGIFGLVLCNVVGMADRALPGWDNEPDSNTSSGESGYEDENRERAHAVTSIFWERICRTNGPAYPLCLVIHAARIVAPSIFRSRPSNSRGRKRRVPMQPLVLSAGSIHFSQPSSTCCSQLERDFRHRRGSTPGFASCDHTDTFIDFWKDALYSPARDGTTRFGWISRPGLCLPLTGVP